VGVYRSQEASKPRRGGASRLAARARAGRQPERANLDRGDQVGARDRRLPARDIAIGEHQSAGRREAGYIIDLSGVDRSSPDVIEGEEVPDESHHLSGPVAQAIDSRPRGEQTGYESDSRRTNSVFSSAPAEPEPKVEDVSRAGVSAADAGRG